MSLRVTHRSLFTSNLANLQQNLGRVQQTQSKLSSGKQLSRPSDDPGGTSAALRQRSDIARNEQLARNASDGLGWLASADSTLNDVGNAVQRVRDLLVGAASTGTMSQTGADAVAAELRAVREQVLSLANTQYADRPIFGGTTANMAAYADDGTWQGDTQRVARSVRPGTTIDVSVTGPEVFGNPVAGVEDLFQFLDRVATDLENGEWSALSSELAAADAHLERTWGARSTVGAKYAQLETMRDRTDEELLVLKERLSEIEDIDLPATIVDLQLQETAYQAALSATARSVQPSLMDFLR